LDAVKDTHLKTRGITKLLQEPEKEQKQQTPPERDVLLVCVQLPVKPPRTLSPTPWGCDPGGRRASHQ